MCVECGVRGLTLPGSAQWFENYNVCEECQQHRSSVCCVCRKAAIPPVGLQCCGICHRLVQCTMDTGLNSDLFIQIYLEYNIKVKVRHIFIYLLDFVVLNLGSKWWIL